MGKTRFHTSYSILYKTNPNLPKSKFGVDNLKLGSALFLCFVFVLSLPPNLVTIYPHCSMGQVVGSVVQRAKTWDGDGMASVAMGRDFM